MSLRNTAAVLTVLFAHVCVTAAAADVSYETIQQALDLSCKEVNKFEIPPEIYKLDEATARDYFTRYFADHQVSYALRINLGYPVFHWGNNQPNLQAGLAPALIAHVGTFFADHNAPAAISAALVDDVPRHYSLFHALGMLARIAGTGKLTTPQLAKIHADLLQVLQTSRLAVGRATVIDREKYPCVNTVKLQLVLACFSLAVQGEDMPLFERTVELPGLRGQFQQQLGVLILDNGGFSTAQLRGIRDVVRALPKELHVPLAVVCPSLCLSSKAKGIRGDSFRCDAPMAIVPNLAPGSQIVKPFPKDHPATVVSDQFMLTFAREFTRALDTHYLPKAAYLKAYKEAVFKSAGKPSGNYLATPHANGYFEGAPHQFMPSLAEVYFSYTEHALAYALTKAREGNLHHINQFALMASLFSDDSRAAFFRIDERGRVHATAIKITKENGLLSGITLKRRPLRFIYTGGLITKVEGL